MKKKRIGHRIDNNEVTKMDKKNIVVKGIEVRYKNINEEDYICLTDIAKCQNSIDPSFTIKNWLRKIDTINYIGLWEHINNDKFNLVEFDQIKTEYGKNSFAMSPTQWVKRTNSIGIFSKRGKYSEGTYAHKDIAFEFASWLSPEFKLYLITEFQRLKKLESKNKEWSAKRELAKVNYKIHTSSIKENLIVPELSKEQIYYTYASEADLLNVALFGITASEWRKCNKELTGNIRDYASIEQLLVLANMESYNAMLIEQGLDSKDRIVMLNNMAKSQIKVLVNNNSKILENK